MVKTMIFIGTSRNSIIGMQIKVHTGAIRRYREDLQQRYALENWIYRGAYG